MFIGYKAFLLLLEDVRLNYQRCLIRKYFIHINNFKHHEIFLNQSILIPYLKVSFIKRFSSKGFELPNIFKFYFDHKIFWSYLMFKGRNCCFKCSLTASSIIECYVTWWSSNSFIEIFRICISKYHLVIFLKFVYQFIMIFVNVPKICLRLSWGYVKMNCNIGNR